MKARAIDSQSIQSCNIRDMMLSYAKDGNSEFSHVLLEPV